MKNFNNLYLIAVIMAFKEFLEEEGQGEIFTEVRLVKKIERARKSFPEDWENLFIVKEIKSDLVTIKDRL